MGILETLLLISLNALGSKEVFMQMKNNGLKKNRA